MPRQDPFKGGGPGGFLEPFIDYGEKAAAAGEARAYTESYAKKQIREKQIRALRNRYRPAAGFLRAEARGLDLGPATGLPSKLGTP